MPRVALDGLRSEPLPVPLWQQRIPMRILQVGELTVCSV